MPAKVPDRISRIGLFLHCGFIAAKTSHLHMSSDKEISQLDQSDIWLSQCFEEMTLSPVKTKMRSHDSVATTEGTNTPIGRSLNSLANCIIKIVY